MKTVLRCTGVIFDLVMLDGCFSKLHMPQIVSSIVHTTLVNDKCPRCFFGFCRKLTRTKKQQSTYKAIGHNGHTVRTRVSSGGIKFVFYLLSFLHFTSSIFASISLLDFTSTTARLLPPPPHPSKQGCHNKNKYHIAPDCIRVPSSASEPPPPTTTLPGDTYIAVVPACQPPPPTKD